MTDGVIFHNGRVFTGDVSAPWARAVSIAAERVVAVGDDDTVLAGAGPSVEVVDLDGRLLTPGFIDAHVHPGTSGLDRLRVDFGDATDAATAAEAVGRYARANPDVPWIVGSGWSQAWFPRGCPPVEALDAVVSDRPAVLWNTDGHSGWANSIALRIGGVDAGTPDPDDGRIERRADGSPQGTLHEGAVSLVERHAPLDTPLDFEAGLLIGQEELLSLGITGWQDAHVFAELHEAYLNLAASGRLKARVVGALWWDGGSDIEQVEELVELRRHGADRFSPTSVKLMLDGVAENFTASVLDPWLGEDGEPTTNRGIDFIDPGLLPTIVTELDARGFQCHFHVIGDRAARNALDAIEAARKANGPSDNRHHLAHIQLVHPDDIGRFAGLDVVANAQALWARYEIYQDELTIPFLGPRRASWQYPFRSLLDAGARMAMGSDWGVSTANVMEQIATAVTRTGESHRVFFPEERITPLEALTAFTAGSAYVNHVEDETGSLRPGMLADLALLDRDPFSNGSFGDSLVTMTMVGGEVVYGDLS